MKFDLKRRIFDDCSRGEEMLAVSGENRDLTWRALREEAAELAERLRSHGVGPGHPVVIYGHKEVEFVVGICACLLLGCPWIPVDTIYPAERLARIRAISGSGVVLRTVENRLEVDEALVRSGSNALSTDLCYVIFTSGSTGEPKGVQIPYEAVWSLLEWMDRDFGLPETPVLMNQAPFSFDLSMYELFLFLHRGGTVILNSQRQLADQEGFLARVRRSGITVWVSTPSLAWQQVLSPNFNGDYLPDLRDFLFCGEVLPQKLAQRLRRLFPRARVLNTYGPTEATVATTFVEITDEIVARYDPLPVGYPKFSSEIFIAPENGEICIVGDNVMVGYLNRPDLNAVKRFDHHGRRGFRTGDAGEYRDGMLFCHGRMDDQIKLRGYRIELSEIDACLESLDDVAQAATIAIRSGDRYSRLVSFVVAAAGSTPDEKRLAAALALELPEYMIPSEILFTATLPVSVNHKIDRKQLLNTYERLARGEPG